MDDLINRQQAINKIKPWLEVKGYGWGELNMLRAVINELENMPSAQPEQQWIPVTERLPEKNGSYWVCGRWGSGKIAVGDCEYSTEDGYFQTAWNFNVLAWMPLPEPYKGER